MPERDQGGAAGRGLDDGQGARTGETQDAARRGPADKRPTDPEAIEASDLPERDKQYGGDDN